MKRSIKQAIMDEEMRIDAAEQKLEALKEKQADGVTEVHVTNEDLFLELAEDTDSMIVAMARTMLLQEAERIIRCKDEVIEQHKDSIVSGEYVIHCAEEVVKIFKHKE